MMDLTLTLFEIALVLGGLLYAIHVYGTWNYGRFVNTKVPYFKPVALVGNAGRFFLAKEDLLTNTKKLYKTFPEHRFVGTFQMRNPALLIRDPELIRQIGVKDFEYFMNHQVFIDDKMDPLFGNALISLQGQKWRDMRATLSPAFTGSKMRAMYSLVSECAQQMAEYLKKESEVNGPQVFEMKDLFTRYTNDVIATAAFGIQINSLENRENLFFQMGKRISNFKGFIVMIKFFIIFVAPRLMTKLGITFFDGECSTFFHELVHGTMKVREEKGIVRPDMIHLLMQARQGTLQHDNTNTTLTQQQDAGFATVTESDVGKKQVNKRAWTDAELTAQAMIFFLAGFDTTSTSLCFTSHELAVNPDVQKKLQQEIDEVCEELGSDQTPDYERINRMKYLDMVISEGLRMWPPVPFLDRVCLKPYNLVDHEGNTFEVRKNETVMFPAYHIHHDAKYYSIPDKFDPERFSDENKKNIKPFTYLPFGVGPRNCIGSRFALMDVKAILFNILRNFDIVPCEKTQIPLRIAKSAFTIQAEKGFWVSLVPRKSN